jgi:hypothetical protein
MTKTAERTAGRERAGRKPVDRHVLVLPIPESIEMGSCVFSRIGHTETGERCPATTGPHDPPAPPGPPPPRP